MLVLSRKKNESILIDGCIRVTVVKIDGNSVRIGIDAPGDVTILRGELADKNDALRPRGEEACRRTFVDAAV